MFCSLITAGALTSTDTYQFNPRAAQHTEADKPVQASLPCWQQHPKAFKRQSRAQQTLGKSPSETLPCARLRTQLLLTAPPGSSLGRRCGGILATFPAPASPWDPSAVPFKSHLLLLCPPALCKAVLQAPRLEVLAGLAPQSHLRLCRSVSSPPCHRCSRPRLTQLLKGKPSVPLLPAERSCFVPVRSRGRCAHSILDAALGELRRLRRAAPAGAPERPALPSGGSRCSSHRGLRGVPGPAQRALSPHPPLKRQNHPRCQTGTWPPRAPCPSPESR